MPKISTTVVRTFAVTALAGGLAFAGPLRAAPVDASVIPLNQMNPPSMDQPSSYQAPPRQVSYQAAPAQIHHVAFVSDHSPQAMQQHVEDRIRTLHAKLGITNSEEPKWNDVAQAMRDNEATLSQLIQERHQNPARMTAVDDLQSYGKITQAHADGFQKLIPAFQSLYDDMSDEQRAKADKIFSHFEGHHDASAKKHV